MLRDTPRLRRFEADYQHTAYRTLTFVAALALHAQFLEEALALNPDFGTDWKADLSSDLAVARALNGLPPA